jgi:hypothetical protein
MFKLYYLQPDGSSELQCQLHSEDDCKIWAAKDNVVHFSIEFQDDIQTTVVYEQ